MIPTNPSIASNVKPTTQVEWLEKRKLVVAKTIVTQYIHTDCRRKT
jgi:hypothetical protein